jgi:hypothetical protein
MRQTLFTLFVDRFMGRGAAAVTVPPLDGALKHIYVILVVLLLIFG